VLSLLLFALVRGGRIAKKFIGMDAEHSSEAVDEC
jgi:hypothetical protein